MTVNKQAQVIISDIRIKHGSGDVYAPIIRWDEFELIAGALEAAEKRIAELESREVVLPAAWWVKQGSQSLLAYEKGMLLDALTAAGIITKVGE